MILCNICPLLSRFFLLFMISCACIYFQTTRSLYIPSCDEFTYFFFLIASGGVKEDYVTNQMLGRVHNSTKAQNSNQIVACPELSFCRYKLLTVTFFFS